MSLEKEITLRALGAEIIRTPTEAPSESEESNIGVAKRLQKLIPGGVILDQYNNPANPDAHEFGTGPEIIEAIENTPSTTSRLSSGKVDVLFAGAGTGGTITGISRAIKRHHPNSIVVGIDPKGSLIARPEELNKLDGESASYVVEGIGYDFIPGVLSHDQVDQWVKTDDNEAWAAARKLMRTEGLLVGGSSGSVLAGALRWLTTEEGMMSAGGVEGKNAVIILPDGIRNYMSKPWFAELARGDGQSELAKQIAELLKKP
ncbi:tryptophan synthase beta subunit-like PLP-dependent enzyme [Cantharellus anzutake]|uniref:tryptophan synthase beta subunit-like PLP-dependent enzyme n=1 Tax=Cantharellus anzutake TaxID=1750568 RepID=UPI001903218D|nr:tryptophan synthase beta subunit-like PLP-dependent enzyme [Cantharellus anzutake]KAF8325795.1 tryptophan synthase beta subunit-like PLP-dependent enzyme [Cantharellus anzutake]